ESPARAQHELTLRLLLGQRLMAARGHAVPAVGESYTRALTLAQQVGEPRQHGQALQGLFSFHLIQAQLRTAGELCQQLFCLASHQPDPTLVLEGSLSLGHLAFYWGDLETSRAHWETSLRLVDVPQAPHALFSGGYEVRSTILTYLAWILWLVGGTDQAR